MHHLLIIGENVEQHRAYFARHFAVHTLSDAPDKDAKLVEIGPLIEGLCLSGGANPRGDKALLDKLPNLSIVATLGVGVGVGQGAGHGIIDVDAVKARGLVATYGPGSNATSVADLVLGFMLALSRRIIHFDRFTRDGRWAATNSKGGYTDTITGKRVGIVGLGNIGRAVAQRCAGFDMEIGYHQRTPRSEVAYRYHGSVLALAEASQYLVVSVPDSPETRGMIDAAVLEALGRDGYLINVARGSVVDEAALIAALKDGTIAGAGLDVFQGEPNLNPELARLDTVIVSPHRAAFTHDATLRMRDMMMDNLLAHFAGRPVPNPIPGFEETACGRS